MTDYTDEQAITDRLEHPPMGFDQPQELSILQVIPAPIALLDEDDEGRLGFTIDDIRWQ